MHRIIREAERTGRAAVEQAHLPRLPKTLTAGPAATRLRHLKLWYCMLPDDALPPLGRATTTSSTEAVHTPSLPDPVQEEGKRGEGLATSEDRSGLGGFGASLRSLHLGSNLLTKVPTGLETLSHLRELIIDGNYITSVPPSIMQLRRLTLLVLSYNSLTSLPEGFWGAFPELTYLSLHHNQLTCLGSDFYDLGLQLEVLYLHYNKIEHIEEPPPSASTAPASFPRLRSLSLSHNQLTSVPDGLVSRMSGLQLLFLEHNQLEQLPESLCGLSRLELLRVDCNRLRSLPQGMTAMSSLVALDCDHNQIGSLPKDVLHLKKHANLRVLRAVGNPLGLAPDDELFDAHSLFCDVYLDGEGMDRRKALSVPLFLEALVARDELRQLPPTSYYDLRSSYSHRTSVSQLQVYRQWDSATCGYHALKNAVIGVLAYIHKKDEEEISESILRLMRSAPHFWSLFFHWQALLLQKAHKVREKALAKGRKWDVVWQDVNVKHGIMERNYIQHLQQQDKIIQEIGPEHFVVISDLDYISGDPYDVPAIVALDERLSLHSITFKTGRYPVKAFVIGVSKSHFITIIAYLDRSKRPKHASLSTPQYIIADSSDYEDQAATPSSATGDEDEEVEMDVDEQLGTQRRVRSIEPNVRMIIDCLMGQDSFRSFYLRRIVEGFVHQSLMLLVDWDTSEVDPTKIQDWQLSAATFFSSFFSKALALGVHEVKSSTKEEIRAYCRQLSANDEARQLLRWMLEDNREGMEAVFGLEAGEDPLAALLAHPTALPARI